VLSRALVDHGVATFVAIPPGVVQLDEFHWVCPCFQVPCYAVREQVRVYLLWNGDTSSILVPLATLTAVRVKVHDLLLLPTMPAQVFPPSLSDGRVLPRKHEGLSLGDVIVLHVPVLVDGVHLLDSPVLDRNILVAPWRPDGRRSKTTQLPTLRFFPYNAHTRDAFSISAHRCLRDETGSKTDGEHLTVFEVWVTPSLCSRNTCEGRPKNVSIYHEG
jgi:hypothetical protein